MDEFSPADNHFYEIAVAARVVVLAIDRVTTTGEVKVQPSAVAVLSPQLRWKGGGHTVQYREKQFETAGRVLEAMTRGEAPAPEDLKTARSYFARLADDCERAVEAD